MNPAIGELGQRLAAPAIRGRCRRPTSLARFAVDAYETAGARDNLFDDGESQASYERRADCACRCSCSSFLGLFPCPLFPSQAAVFCTGSFPAG
jgi:hypothetical protein